ncbi:MAG: phosphoenolpyruvate carboxykinase (GTP) [Deltaproteobacteria bacterium]|nr:phosphoenolpyruvate carboxykinase (GTP) [Deltaproteobacteria bacterium]
MSHTASEDLKQWVANVARLALPERIHWCDGSEEEYNALVSQMLASGQLHELNQEQFPRCYLHRSDPSDVARTEHLTFVCTKSKDEAGPNNNWKEPAEAHAEADRLFAGVMKGRTMYVVPYCMGPLDSPHSRCGVEITDSAYVAASMKIMTRMGKKALLRLGNDKTFVKGLHSIGDLKVEHRRIFHFPEEKMIKSIGSGYGGNALLGKKCHALRIASYQARQEAWLAEHMLIAGIENPQGEIFYIAAAFPSACGKTNLAMLIPPEQYKGWKVWTVGDDIAWMHLGEDGYLYAMNPEAGFFGVAPGTSSKTNANAVAMLNHDTIFTNVGVTADNTPWWEGLDEGQPVVDWKGDPFDGTTPAAHPNSRFTVSSRQCPSYTKAAEDPRGVRISAIIFGGRRPSLIPLVYEAKNWAHGVLVGASMASQTTAAATGVVGIVRRDPMAMKPFCGYNFGDYWDHWLSFAKKSDKLPKVFHVNWFRRDEKGNFMWPGYGDNIRVLRWILDRANRRCDAVETPLGFIPRPGSIDTTGLNIAEKAMHDLCDITPSGWKEEWDEIGKFLNSFGTHLPAQLKAQYDSILKQINR